MKFKTLFLSLLFVTIAGLDYVTSVCHRRDYGHGSVVCVCGSDPSVKCEGELNGVQLPPKGSILTLRTSKSGDRFLVQSVKFEKSLPNSTTKADLKIDIKPNAEKHQTIVGFGGAFTDTTGYNLKRMPQELSKQIMEDYFGSNGIGYRMARIPIGSTDFSLRAYSLDDRNGTQEDLTLSGFALAKEDFDYKIPYMKMANEITGNQMKFFASAWGPPAWMKVNNRLNHGGLLKGPPSGPYYDSYAKYIVKFLQEYQKQKVEFWGVNVVNEPSVGYDPNYIINSLALNSTLERDFVKLNLGPQLVGSGFEKVKLMIHDDNVHLMEEAVKTILADKEAAKYVSGVSFHWYFNGRENRNQNHILARLSELFPTMFFLPTEACELKPLQLGNWTRAEHYAADIINDLNNNAVGWIEWNMALDWQGGPSYIHTNFDDTLMVNVTSAEYYKQPSFYVIGHFAKYILPGSKRIETEFAYAGDRNREEANLLATVFERPDGYKVAVVFNRNEKPVKIEFYDPAEGYLLVDVTERSIQTFVWN